MIFVFGSNEAGVHGAGSALDARIWHGAVYGVGIGRQGNSYGIPTKGMRLEILSPAAVKAHVDVFVAYAKKYPQAQFMVTAVGCGHAKFTHDAMAVMFTGAPDNCWFDTLWKPFLGDSRKYWGTWTNAGGYEYTPEYESATASA